MHYKVARWISGEGKETRFHESEITSSPKKARRVYNEFKKDPRTTRLTIWRYSRGVHEQINVNELPKSLKS